MGSVSAFTWPKIEINLNGGGFGRFGRATYQKHPTAL